MELGFVVVPRSFPRVCRKGTQQARRERTRWDPGSRRSYLRLCMEADHGHEPAFFYWDGCPTFLQCPNCRAVFALESEEICGEPRMVICSMCLHGWRAFEKEIIWGEDAAIKSIKDAPERPLRRRPRSRRASRDENALSVFVGGLAYSCTEDDLFAAFCSFGEISRCQIPQKAGTPRGIGFVEFRNKDDAIRAIETLDGASILGRKICLSVANVDTNKELEDDERLDAATKSS
ncbi:hypothetical protein NDN08_006085 [Rhodosorus marinus]|uniref:RRM domain-containing protein n=1 Tax=Rhodosorus marinus TaxID=101924 RepID=A0AAV8UJN9_9RHOD|nr:hypothetical protein NDN08_006085 [Rhodosorus marinus]